MQRGFFGIGIFYPKHETNCGTLFRSALAFNANFIFTVGRQYKVQSSDTCNSIKHIPYFNYLNREDFVSHLPKGCQPVIVEIDSKAHSLEKFVHPERACYLLGSEGGGIPKEFIQKYQVVKIPTEICLNVAIAGSIVLYDRISKQCK